ncbi:MAG: AMP-binding protein [Desulfobacterales bacterium]|nr:AMP-binding protein [Desulfobacterales bacterium]
MNQYPETLIQAFSRADSRETGKRPFASGDRTITYDQLCGQVRLLAGLFQDLGLTPGDRLVFSTQDDLLAAILFIALLRTGITAVFLDAETKPRRARRLIELTGPGAMVLDQELIDSWQPTTACPVVPVRNQPAASLVSRLLGRPAVDDSLAGRLAAVKPVSLPERLDPQDDAYVLFTSGTTADPKGVCITHHALDAHLRTLSSVYRMDSTTRILNTLILSHADGMIQGPVLAFFNTARWYRPFRFSVQHIEETLDLIFRERITHYVAVPTILALLCRLGGDQRDSFQNGAFQFLISCGAHLETNLWQRFEEMFAMSIINVYGLTETVAGGLFAGHEPDRRPIGTIGRTVDCAARLVDENGQDVPAGGRGELLISGDLLMRGYFNAPEATDRVLSQGWLYTGDIAEMDDMGCYRILGRKKAVIISGGFNVHPEEVTEVLNTHPAVVEAATLGIPDPVWGEKVISVVALKAGAAINEKALTLFSRQHLEGKKVPAAIHIVESLPRGRSGKVRLEELRGVINGRRIIPAAPLDPQSETRLLRLAAACFKTEVELLSLDTAEEQTAEWDSLVHLQLIAEVEKNFEIRFSAAEIIGIRTLGDIHALCEGKTGAPGDGC